MNNFNFKGLHLYERDVAILKDYGGIKQSIVVCKWLKTKGLEVENKRYSPKGQINDKKLDCNVSRAKSKLFEYAYCNDWDYFVTLTINSAKFDRFDLKGYYKKFAQFLNNYNKRYNIKISYLFVPELHDNGAWHMHGFIMGLPSEHLIINDNGYLDWLPYSKNFGWISLDKIRDKQRASSYITKYINKNLSDCVSELGAKMYYNSHGLKTATEIKRGKLNCELSNPGFENDYVIVKDYYHTDVGELSDMIDSI